MADRNLATAWRTHLVLLVAAYAVLVAAFFDTFANMVGVWAHSSTFNHCFLIPFIAAYLGLTKRAQLAVTMPAVSGYGLIYILLNSLLWLVGELMSVAFAMHAAVIGMLIGVAWAVLGNRAFWVLVFPFFYLYFAVPEGEFLVPYLQDWTALVLVKLLQLTGIPVFIEGRYLTIPSGNFVVAEACSGVNYLIATLAVGMMFMYLQFRSPWRRLLFLVVAVMVPLLANGLRAYGIVMISHLSNFKYAQGVDHFIYGGVFFGLVIFALFSLGSLFSDVDRTAQVVPTPALGRPTAKPRLALILLLAAGAALGPRGALLALDLTRSLAAEVSLPQVPGWLGPAARPSALRPNFPGADQYLSARYQAADGQTVSVDVVYFSKQGVDGELINQSNRVFDKEAWRQLDYGRHESRAGDAVHDIDVLRLRTPHAEVSETLFWSWYDSQGHRSANRLSIKIAEGLARLTGRNEGGAFIVLGTPVGQQTEQAVRVLEAFLDTGALTLERMHAPR